MRRIIGFCFLIIGVFAVQIWIVGSHGHMKFRPWMIEDWLIVGTMAISFIAFIFLSFPRKKTIR